jgi:hypothetical protein
MHRTFEFDSREFTRHQRLQSESFEVGVRLIEQALPVIPVEVAALLPHWFGDAKGNRLRQVGVAALAAFLTLAFFARHWQIGARPQFHLVSSL